MNSSKLNQLSCWVVTGGRIGTEKQCIALAEVLGLAPHVKRVKERFPWRYLPEALWVSPLKAYSSKGDLLTPPWPDVLISSGRSAAAAAAKIRDLTYSLGARRTFGIHVMGPRLSSSAYDVVVAPQHSQVKGGNVIETLGALHSVDPAKVDAYSLPSLYDFSALQKPKIAVFRKCSHFTDHRH